MKYMVIHTASLVYWIQYCIVKNYKHTKEEKKKMKHNNKINEEISARF